MTDYETFTFKRKNHWNDFAPDVKLIFTTHHTGDDLLKVIDMMVSFLITCGYNEDGIKQVMSEYLED